MGSTRLSVRSIVALSGLALSAGVGLATAPVAQASATTAAGATVTSLTVNGVRCTDVREIGTKGIGRDKGIAAFTVRQYIGRCTDSRGTARMNFASTYVWAQYHALGTSYRASASIAPDSYGDETAGAVIGTVRQRLVWSTPVRTVNECTRAFSKLVTGTVESRGSFSSRVC